MLFPEPFPQRASGKRQAEEKDEESMGAQDGQGGNAQGHEQFLTAHGPEQQHHEQEGGEREAQGMEGGTVCRQNGQHKHRFLPAFLAARGLFPGAPEYLNQPPQTQLERHQAEQGANTKRDKARPGGASAPEVELKGLDAGADAEQGQKQP